jgi:hypothetical protein
MGRAKEVERESGVLPDLQMRVCSQEGKEEGRKERERMKKERGET